MATKQTKKAEKKVEVSKGVINLDAIPLGDAPDTVHKRPEDLYKVNDDLALIVLEKTEKRSDKESDGFVCHGIHMWRWADRIVYVKTEFNIVTLEDAQEKVRAMLDEGWSEREPHPRFLDLVRNPEWTVADDEMTEEDREFVEEFSEHPSIKK